MKRYERKMKVENTIKQKFCYEFREIMKSQIRQNLTIALEKLRKNDIKVKFLVKIFFWQADFSSFC